MFHSYRLLTLLLLPLLALPASAVALKTALPKSAVTAVFKQFNVPVEAKFNKFSAQIDFDSAKPESAKASVEIDIGSFGCSSCSIVNGHVGYRDITVVVITHNQI